MHVEIYVSDDTSSHLQEKLYVSAAGIPHEQVSLRIANGDNRWGFFWQKQETWPLEAQGLKIIIPSGG